MSFSELKTERLILRPLKETDVAAIYSLRTDDTVNKYIDRKKPTSFDEANEFINETIKGITDNKWIYWAITLKDNPKLIGTVCFWNFSETKNIAEIGFELNPEFHGQGIMNEVLKSVLDFGFKIIGLEIIEAFIHKDNIASRKLVVKNNFNLDTERRINETELIFRLKNPKL